MAQDHDRSVPPTQQGSFPRLSLVDVEQGAREADGYQSIRSNSRSNNSAYRRKSSGTTSGSRVQNRRTSVLSSLSSPPVALPTQSSSAAGSATGFPPAPPTAMAAGPSYYLRPSIAVIDIDPAGGRVISYPRICCVESVESVETDSSRPPSSSSTTTTRSAEPVTSDDSLLFLPDDPPLSDLPVGGVRVVLREVSLTTAWNMVNIAAGNIRSSNGDGDSRSSSSRSNNNPDDTAWGRLGTLRTVRTTEASRTAAAKPVAPSSPSKTSEEAADLMWATLTTVEEQIKKRILNLPIRPFSMRYLQMMLRERPGGNASANSNSSANSSSSLSSFVFLQTPLFKDVTTQGSILPPDASLGLHPLLSPSWRFSEALNDTGISFSDANILVKFQHRLDGRSIVFCCFPALCSEVRCPGHENEALSPALRAFEALLLSGESAVRRMEPGGHGNSSSRGTDVPERRRLTCQLVLVDLMRATMELWDRFVVTATAHADDKSQLAVGEGLLSQLRTDSHRGQRVEATVRDMGQCLRFLLASVDEAAAEVQQAVWGAGWRGLVRELRAQEAETRAVAGDLGRRAQRNLAAYSSTLFEKQGQSATRLTLVAAVFLPLSLSASLLSMNTAAVAIGGLWVDWVGLSIVLAVLLYLLHLAVRTADDALSSVPGQPRHGVATRLTASVRQFEGVVLRCLAVAVSGGLFYALVAPPASLRVNAWLCGAVVGFSLLVLVALNAAHLRGLWQLALHALQLNSFVRILSWTGVPVDGSDMILRHYARGRLTAFLASYNGWRVVEALAYFAPLRRWIVDKRLLILVLLYRDARHQDTLRILRRMAAQDPNVRDMLKDLIHDLHRLASQGPPPGATPPPPPPPPPLPPPPPTVVPARASLAVPTPGPSAAR